MYELGEIKAEYIQRSVKIAKKYVPTTTREEAISTEVVALKNDVDLQLLTSYMIHELDCEKDVVCEFLAGYKRYLEKFYLDLHEEIQGE